MADIHQDIQLVKAHFQEVDPVIAELFDVYEIEILPREVDHTKYFFMMCQEIIGQQLSVKAARAINGRFNDLFPGEHAQPDEILSLEEHILREVGMSWAKVRAVRDLAERTLTGELLYEKFADMEDGEIMGNLQLVKGVGPWTTEMFLIFILGREDVFSIKDLGLRNAAVKNYALRPTRTLEFRILKLSKKWAPYRSYASLLLWKSLDNKP